MLSDNGDCQTVVYMVFLFMRAKRCFLGADVPRCLRRCYLSAGVFLSNTM